jgi:hypothetical protein
MSVFKVGDCGFIKGSSPHEGLWSVIIDKIANAGANSYATLRFDGIVVPPSAMHGVKNPQESDSHTLQPYNLKTVTQRQPEADDDQKRKTWLATCATHEANQLAELIKQNKALLQKYSHVKVDDKATYKTIMGWGPQEYEETISVTVTEIVDDPKWAHVMVKTAAGKTLPLSFGQLIY